MPAALLLLVLAAAGAFAHDPITTKLTWSREISRIVYKHCGSCHRANGDSPMSLLTYEEARPWAKAIKEEVLERRMPPWGAVKGFGDFSGDRALSWEDLHQIADWVEGGAPEGDPIYLPSRPNFTMAEKEAVPRGLPVAGTRRLTTALRLAAVRPADLPKGTTLRAVARRPDGSIEPLLWLYAYDPRFPQTYRYRKPLALPAGTMIEVFGEPGNAIILIPEP